MKIKQTLCGLLGGLLSYLAPGSIPATAVTIAKAAPVVAIAGGAMLMQGCTKKSKGSSDGDGGDDGNDDDPPTPDPVHAYWQVNPPQEIFEDSTLPITMRAERDPGTSDYKITTNDNILANNFFLWWQSSSGGAWDNETANPGTYYNLRLSLGIPSDLVIQSQRTFPDFYIKPAGQYNIKVNARTIDDPNFYYSTVKPLTINFSDLNAMTKLDSLITTHLSGDPKYGGHVINVTIGGIPTEVAIVWNGSTRTIEYIGKSDTLGDKRTQFSGIGIDCSEFSKCYNEGALLNKLNAAKLDDFTGNDLNTDGKQSPY